MKVYFWRGPLYSSQYAGSWVNVTWGAAVSSKDELRRLCSQHREYPTKPYQSGPDQAEWEAATERPGSLVFRNLEPTGDETGDWQTLPTEGQVPLSVRGSLEG